MTTVDTIDDIIRILREQPEAKEAIRRLILTDELLRLPQQIAEIAAIVQRTAEIQDRHTRFLEQHTRDIGELKSDTSELKSDASTLKSDTSELKRDSSWLKGLAAFIPTERRYQIIALDMGLEPVRLLDPGEIVRMTMTEAALEFDQSDLNSFRDCDLIIAAQSPSDGDCYIAVQVSYTVDHSDISRAIKHAEMVTRFTGKPALPAVSGVQRADVTERRLSTDAVYMHRLPRSSTQPR